ncbi:hypothetical protein MHBO_004281 [Bonamia ostreae]|uniref:Uncharacterized protein n=1 Tax=Bonamia ostreae TaxID=126728 RepID=A0ABV2ASW1_9EUKA
MFPAPFEDGNEKGSPQLAGFNDSPKLKKTTSKNQLRNLRKKMSKKRREKSAKQNAYSTCSSDELMDAKNLEEKKVYKPITEKHSLNERFKPENFYFSDGENRKTFMSSFKELSKFPEVLIEWSTFSASPVLHLVVRLAFKGKVGQCSIPTPYGCFSNEQVVEAKQKLCHSGLPLKSNDGGHYYARFLIEFGIG